MAKTKRGKYLKSQANWRGTCPNCKRTRVKLAWRGNNGDTVCKHCR